MYVDDGTKIVERHLPHRHVPGDACVVDHHVDATVGLDTGLHQRLHFGFVRDVTTHAERGTARYSRRRLGDAVLVEIAQHDLGAFVDKTCGDRKADALRASSDDRAAAVEQSHGDWVSHGKI